MYSNKATNETQTLGQYLKKILNFKAYSWINWIIFIGVLLSLTSFCLILAGIGVNTVRHNSSTAFWFYSLHFFTQQSNLLIIFFIVAYWLFPQSKIFSKNSLMIFCMAYITVTFLGYNCILLPTDIASGVVKSNTDFDWTITVFLHMIMPLYFLTVYLTLAINKKLGFLLPWYKNLGFGMIYPMIYLIYALVLPFVTEFSVYGTFTNLNPNNSSPEAGGVPGSLFNLIYFAGFIALFLFFLWVFWFIIYKKTQKLSK